MEACVIAQALVLHYLAKHVADEMDVEVSKEVGYTIRFEDSRRSARS